MWQPAPLRRKDRAMTEAEAMDLLKGAEWGVLATASAAGLPLATPLNYVVMGDALYFHCAQSGQKLNNLAAQPRVCFVAVGATRPLFDGDFTTLYQSAMVHGAAALVQDEAEKTAALTALCEKYLPQHMDKAGASIGRSLAHTAVVRVHIEQLTGKAKREKA